MAQFLTFFLIIAVVVFGYVLFGAQKTEPPKEKNFVKNEKVEKIEISSDESAPVSVPVTSEPSAVFEKNENPETADSAASEFALDIQAPSVDMTVASPFLVQGRAKGGSSIAVRVLNTARTVLIEEKINLKAAPDSEGYRAFQAKLNYEFANTREGFLEVALLNEAGEEKNQQEVPLKFL